MKNDLMCGMCGKNSVTLFALSMCSTCFERMQDDRDVKPTKLGPQKETLTSTQGKIASVCNGVRDMLLAKNKAYGDSAINPVRVFSKASPEEQLLVRIDDKLSRLARGSAAGEDVVDDLIGYLVLLKVSRLP